METIHAQRLVKLAHHLLYGQLGHEVFDFAHVNESDTDEYQPNGCGTNGCAIGEMPFVWPEKFSYSFYMDSDGDEYGDQYFKIFNEEFDSLDFFEAAEWFFGVNPRESTILFCPSYGIKGSRIVNDVEFYELGTSATKEQVANQILKFVEAKGFDLDEIVALNKTQPV